MKERIEKTDEYLVCCQLQYIKCDVLKITYISRLRSVDPDIISDMVRLGRKIKELEEYVDDKMLDGYFRKFDAEMDRKLKEL